ncbi:hypothetical protein ACR82Q_000268 [Yersinia enterocolitica]
MKKLKFDFRLSHILFFFFGVIVTVVLLWILYKDPTRITAPALAALTAMCTFLLALWSAFKVNKWLNSKVNDAAFKQTEKVLGYIESSYTEIRPLLSMVAKLSQTRVSIYENEQNLIAEIKQKIESIEMFCNNAVMSTYMLKYWDANLTKEGDKLLDDFVTKVRELLKKSITITETYDKKSFGNELLEFNVIVDDFTYSLNRLLSAKYKELFEHNVKPTSPSKKVSE